MLLSFFLTYSLVPAILTFSCTYVHQATAKIPNLYKGTIYEVLYNSWRDERTMDEIGWYGWLIDYWMEGGIMRDYFDHKLTTPQPILNDFVHQSYGHTVSCNGTTTTVKLMDQSLKSAMMKCVIQL